MNFAVVWRVSLRFSLTAIAFCFIPPPSAFGQATPNTTAEEETPLPKLIDMPLPTAESLLRERPRDWVVLLNQDVLVVEPLFPRPDTLKLRREQYDKIVKSKPSEIGPENRTRKMYEYERISVTLLDGGVEPEYLIETKHIEKVIYFEDLILQRVTKLLDEKNPALAYDLITMVDRRQHDWPNLDLHYQRCLFVQAEQHQQAGRYENGLVVLEQLQPLAPEYPNLSVLLGRTVEPLIETAFNAVDDRRARHFLARLIKLQPQHSVAVKWRDKLIARATQELSTARSESQAGHHGEAVSHIDLAARAWPDLAGLKDAHKQFVERHQRLRVGIWQPADNPADPYPGRHAERHHDLGTIPLFEPERVVDGVVRYRSAYFETWEPRDLGREWEFWLRPRRAEWECRPAVTTGLIVDALQRRWDPMSPEYDDRWAGHVAAVSAPSPQQLRMKLERIPLRLEAWLRSPIRLDEATRAWNTDLDPAVWDNPAQQRFRRVEHTDQKSTFVRSRPEPPELKARHLTEIVEQALPNWDRALQALLRGEIDMVPAVEFRDVRGLQSDSRFFTLQAALPRTHIVMFHPESLLMRSAPLRRALLQALPREVLLAETVLEGADRSLGRLSTGPFASTTYGYSKDLPQPVYDVVTAASLVATAKKEHGGTLPTLRIVAPSETAIQRALPRMLEAWQRIGLTVEVVKEPGTQWDMVYRSLRVVEPFADLWPLFSPSGNVDQAAIAPFPHPVREEMLELERAVDWTTAMRTLQRLQQEFLTEARYLPLWEVDEFQVFRRRVAGLNPRPMHPYFDCERWTVQSWFPMETP